MKEGFHRAVVTNNRDPEGRGRVRLRAPHIFGPAETGWATPMFETDVPEVGDRVLTTFESGDSDRLIFVPRSLSTSLGGFVIQGILSTSGNLPDEAVDGHAYLIEGNLWGYVEGTWMNLGSIVGGSEAVFFGDEPPENVGLLWVDTSTPGPNLGAFVPVGGIIMYEGLEEDLPNNWLLCNGQPGTPDLRDRFIVGAGGEYDSGDTGGASQVALTTAQMPSHVHSGPSHTHGSGSLSTNNAGAHAHTLNMVNDARVDSVGQRVRDSTSGSGSATASAGSHSHSISGSTAADGTGNTGSTGSGNSHENRPPYYALAFIKRVA